MTPRESSTPTVVALYLPQYHPIPENDAWWGKGFTEWTNVTKAKPLFRGHYQPDLPADLGFYDLRVPETREAQAQLATQYGVGAFCYYHYWFGNGRRLLHRPFDEVLASGKPDFPFMLCWANETWSGVWHGTEKRTLVEQCYPGSADEKEHFALLLGAFRDPRYLKVDGKPIFMIYRPANAPSLSGMLQHFRSMAQDAGLPGLYLIAEHSDPFWDCKANGFDAFVHVCSWDRRRSWTPWSKPGTKIRNWMLDKLGMPTIKKKSDIQKAIVPEAISPLAIPCIVPGWDNTPRSGKSGFMIQGLNPTAFEEQADSALRHVLSKPQGNRLLFVKSWNEWAEGNHLEPCRRFGRGYLEALQRSLGRHSAEE